MPSKKCQELLQQSVRWIHDHPHACQQDVPRDLLKHWFYEPDPEGTEPPGFAFAVFTYGHLLLDFHLHPVPVGVPKEVPMSKLRTLFDYWQLKLALAELERRSELRFKPLPLFPTTKEEIIHVWTEQPPTADPQQEVPP